MTKVYIFDDGSRASKVLQNEISKDSEYQVQTVKVEEFKNLGEWMKQIKDTGTKDNTVKVFLHFPYEDYSVIDKNNKKRDLFGQVKSQDEKYGNLNIVAYYQNKHAGFIDEEYRALYPQEKSNK